MELANRFAYFQHVLYHVSYLAFSLLNPKYIFYFIVFVVPKSPYLRLHTYVFRLRSYGLTRSNRLSVHVSLYTIRSGAWAFIMDMFRTS
jgi:hypothetical protein